MSSHKINVLHDPKIIGPGSWYTGHLTAAKAKTVEEKKGNIFIAHCFAEYFSCPTCRDHFKKFIDSDPPEQYINEPEGLFFWWFRAHNNANSITGKPQLTYEEAKNLYYGSESTCTSNCGSESPQSTALKPTYLNGGYIDGVAAAQKAKSSDVTISLQSPQISVSPRGDTSIPQRNISSPTPAPARVQTGSLGFMIKSTY